MPGNSNFPLPEDKPEDSDVFEWVVTAQQSPQAFGVLYRQFVTPIFRYLCSRTENVQEAEDLTSQTFIKALESLPQLRRADRFAPWLFTIARNKAMDHFRKQKKHVDVQTTDPQMFVDHQDLAAGLIRSERVAQLIPLLERLDEPDLELLRLRFLGELTFREIAEVTQRSSSAVKKSYYRLLARLKRQLEESNE
jgi:RNA polymerase sigma-70 factor (ECF subfamily)